jgi:Holliday junction resolvase RusA-like endonuclease
MISFIIIIPGRLPGLNEYTKACRSNRYAGAKMKERAENIIQLEIKRQIKVKHIGPVTLNFNWYEPNKRRDYDNIAFAKKFILDSLQACETLQGDGWKYIRGFSDKFYVDKKNPRIEVEIEAV